MMVNGFKLEFGLTLEALMELFSSSTGGGREFVCPVPGLDRNACDE